MFLYLSKGPQCVEGWGSHRERAAPGIREQEGEAKALPAWLAMESRCGDRGQEMSVTHRTSSVCSSTAEAMP